MKLNKKALNRIKLEIMDLKVDSDIVDFTKVVKDLSALAFQVPVTPQDLRTLADDLAEHLRQMALEED